MLTNFVIKDFKSLSDVSIDLGVVNVFVGSNGSGKSNLLEALGVLGAAASGRVGDEELKYRGVRPGVPALYKSSFKSYRAASHIRFEAYSEGAQYAVSLLNPLNKPTPVWSYKNELLQRGKEKIVGRSHNTFEHLNPNAGYAALKAVELLKDDPAGQLLELLKNYAIYAPNTPTLRGIEPDPQSRSPLGLSGGRLPEAIKELDHHLRFELTRTLPSVHWIKHYGVGSTFELPISDSVPQRKLSLRFVDEYMNIGRNILSGYDASEGILYLLFCAVLAIHPNAPHLFAIDNFDQALNPRTARDFTRNFCKVLLMQEDRQVLLTTHNPLVLDGLPLRDDRVRLFAVDRSNKGRTIVSRVTINESILAEAEKGMPLSQQWVMGIFGGVPDSV